LEPENMESKTCNYCFGEGKVPEDGFDGEIITCPVCNGTGSILVNKDFVPHVKCDGAGKIRLKTPFGKQCVLCPDCNGTGWYAPPGF